jgi:NADP-dependent 3-hydroxy acid dehydrogenase YdfG
MSAKIKIFHCSENASEVFLMDFGGVIGHSLEYIDESHALVNLSESDKFILVITDQFLKNRKCLEPLLMSEDELERGNIFSIIYYHPGLSRTDKIFDVKSQGSIDLYYYRNFWERRYTNERRWIIDSDKSQDSDRMNYLNAIKRIKDNFDHLISKLCSMPMVALHQLEENRFQSIKDWLEGSDAGSLHSELANDLLSRVPSLRLELQHEEPDVHQEEKERDEKPYEGDLLKKLIEFKKSQLGDSEIEDDYIKEQIERTKEELKRQSEISAKEEDEKELLHDLAYKFHIPHDEISEQEESIIVDENEEDEVNFSNSLGSKALSLRQSADPDEELHQLLDLSSKYQQKEKETEMSEENGQDRLYYEMALFKYHEGNYPDAQKYYKMAVQINPQLGNKRNDQAFNRKGPLKYKEAISTDQTWIQRDQVQQKDKSLHVLITGATSGIGKSTAEIFAKSGHKLTITGRRKKRLKKIREQWEAQYGIDVDILKFDIRNFDETKKELSKLNGPVDVLINNAGLASGLSEIHIGDIEDWERMIDTNIKGLLYATRCVAPSMVENQQGHIINVGSVAGKEAYPKGNVYNASKFAVEGLTRAMRLDLHKYNIRVSQISPGHVEETEFAKVRFHGDEEKAKIYEDFNPVTSFDIAEIIYFMVTRPHHVNIQDVLVMGTQQASATTIDRSGRKFD